MKQDNYGDFVSVEDMGQSTSVPSGHSAFSWERYQIYPSVAYNNDVQILTISGKAYINQSALIAIKGKAKNGKTFFAQATIVALLKGEYGNMSCCCVDPPTILFVDTEQGKERTQAMQRRINLALEQPEMADNTNLTMLCLRELSPQDRFEQICCAIRDLTPTVAIIDGIRDCVTDFNDIRESMQVVNTLLSLSTEYGTAIVVLIHTNKNDSNIRGHLGTEITNKCDTAVEVEKKDNIIAVYPSACRDKEFDAFSLRITDEGLMQVCDMMPKSRDTKSGYEQAKAFIRERLCDLPQQSIGRNVLQQDIAERFTVSTKTAGSYIDKAITDGFIQQIDKQISIR